MVFRVLSRITVKADGESIAECSDKNNIVNDSKQDIVMISSKDDPECRGNFTWYNMLHYVQNKLT